MAAGSDFDQLGSDIFLVRDFNVAPFLKGLSPIDQRRLVWWFYLPVSQLALSLYFEQRKLNNSVRLPDGRVDPPSLLNQSLEAFRILKFQERWLKGKRDIDFYYLARCALLYNESDLRKLAKLPP